MPGRESTFEASPLLGFDGSQALPSATKSLPPTLRSPIREGQSLGGVITVPVADAPFTLYPPIVPSTSMNNSQAAEEHVKGICSVRDLLSHYFILVTLVFHFL